MWRFLAADWARQCNLGLSEELKMRNRRLFVLAFCVFVLAGTLTEAQMLRPCEP
jgi:hypothetical protein